MVAEPVRQEGSGRRAKGGRHEPALVFGAGPHRAAFPATAIERVVPAPRPIPLPGAPAVIAGLVNVHGAVLPCLDLRRRLGAGPTTIGLETRLIVVATTARRLAVLADGVEGLETLPMAGAAELTALGAGVGLARGLVAPDRGIVLIHDVEALLSADEDADLAAAIAAAEHKAEAP